MLQTVIDHHLSAYAVAEAKEDEHEKCKHRELLSLLRDAQTELSGNYPQHRHRRRGTVYNEIGTVMVQSTHRSLRDEDVLVLYRSVDDGAWYARPADEFGDGRFEPGAALSAYQEAVTRVTHEGERLSYGTVEAVLVTGDMDDRVWRFLLPEWRAFRDDPTFSIDHRDTDDEDMWGNWRLTQVVPRQGLRPRVLIERV